MAKKNNIAYMQGIYNYVPETTRVCSLYSFAAVLYLQFVLHVTLFPMLNVLHFNIQHFLQFVFNVQYGCLLVFPRCRAFPVCCSVLFIYLSIYLR